MDFLEPGPQVSYKGGNEKVGFAVGETQLQNFWLQCSDFADDGKRVEVYLVDVGRPCQLCVAGKGDKCL